LTHLSLFSLEDALLLLCPWFTPRGFYAVTSFNEASEDIGFLHSYSQLPFIAERHVSLVASLRCRMAELENRHRPPLDRRWQVAANGIYVYGTVMGNWSRRFGYACIHSERSSILAQKDKAMEFLHTLSLEYLRQTLRLYNTHFTITTTSDNHTHLTEIAKPTIYCLFE